MELDPFGEAAQQTASAEVVDEWEDHVPGQGQAALASARIAARVFPTR